MPGSSAGKKCASETLSAKWRNKLPLFFQVLPPDLMSRFRLSPERAAVDLRLCVPVSCITIALWHQDPVQEVKAMSAAIANPMVGGWSGESWGIAEVERPRLDSETSTDSYFKNI